MTDFGQLRDLMQREAAAVQRLLEVLRTEEQALAARQTAEIERLTAEKQACLAELEPFGLERERLLTGAGLGADREGFESLLERADQALQSELKALWEDLRTDLAACQAQNLKNGQILEANRQVAHRLLNILLGEADGTELYGRDGTTNSSRDSQTHVKA